MRHDDTNAKVLAQLQEFAQLYFDAIIEANTFGGKCSIKPGKYSATELWERRSVEYELPEDPMFEEELTISANNFKCRFPYSHIFMMLSKWEAMMKAGKLKAVFEVGDVEIISAKVLTKDKTILGEYKEKRMKLQKLHGNWYVLARIKSGDYADIYYKHGDVIFCGGRMTVRYPEEPNREDLISQLDKAESVLTDKLLQMAATSEYFAEVCKRMSIEAQQPATPAETPQISTESAEATNVSVEGEIREIRHISEIVATCRLVVTCCCSPDGTHTYTDEYNYYNWLRNAETIGYQTISDKALNEALINIFLAAYRRGSGHVLAMNNRGELVDTIFVSPTSEPIEKLEHLPKPPKFAPQSPQIAPAVNYATLAPERCQRARRWPDSVIKYYLITQPIASAPPGRCYTGIPLPFW